MKKLVFIFLVLGSLAACKAPDAAVKKTKEKDKTEDKMADKAAEKEKERLKNNAKTSNTTKEGLEKVNTDKGNNANAKPSSRQEAAQNARNNKDLNINGVKPKPTQDLSKPKGGGR